MLRRILDTLRRFHDRLLARPRGDVASFVECRECIVKPGSPTLCESCLERRYLFGKTGWTTWPDWWAVGEIVHKQDRWREPRTIVRIRDRCCELTGDRLGCCHDITDVSPLEPRYRRFRDVA